MISFILSQLLGFIIFTVVNFSLFCYLAYKRNQAFRINTKRKPLSYQFGFLLLFLFFIGGITLKSYNAKESFVEMSLKKSLIKEENTKPKVAENPS